MHICSDSSRRPLQSSLRLIESLAQWTLANAGRAVTNTYTFAKCYRLAKIFVQDCLKISEICVTALSPVSLWTQYHVCYLFFRKGIFSSTFPILCPCIPSYINTNNWHHKYIDLSIVNLGSNYIYALIYNIPPYSETRTRLRVLAKLCEAQFCDKKTYSLFALSIAENQKSH